MLFGINDCQELHDNPDLTPSPYWDRAFAAAGKASEGRQGELLEELTYFDPALESHPILDRHLLKDVPGTDRASQDALASARRRAFFEWDATQLSSMHLSTDALCMRGAGHLDRFRSVPVMSRTERFALCRELCLGIAHLEDLPELAFGLSGLPLRVTPRTPTASSFWVVKPWERFSLDAPLPQTVKGLEVLHTHLRLTYHSPKGRDEILLIGLELFHLLLALKDGAQLAGAAQEGIFAHLDLFVQRITQEDVRELYAWHPEQERAISRLRIELRDGLQTLVREEARHG
jgi:hypothetical protein